MYFLGEKMFVNFHGNRKIVGLTLSQMLSYNSKKNVFGSRACFIECLISLINYIIHWGFVLLN